MKRFFGTLMSVLLVIGLLPATLGVSVGTGVGINVNTEDFKPEIWMCDDRVVTDDSVEPGRNGVASLAERYHNYAFEGEQVAYEVLVMDKNGINKVEDVYMTIGATQGEGNDIEVNCVEDVGFSPIVDPECNARILEEDLTGTAINTQTQRYYTCTFTVETPDSMYNEYFVTAEATDLDGLSTIVRENEYWFLNPVVALSIDGELNFENVRPNAVSYSDTILVGNDADDGSGVMMDMFITGTDFYDTSSSGAMCPTTNQLALNGVGPDGVINTADDTGFRYFVTSGAYSSATDALVDGGVYDPVTSRLNINAEDYLNIQYGNNFQETMYDEAEILQAGGVDANGYYRANVLSPDSEMALTFSLNLPEPCNGDFDSGQIFFWGEAV